MKTGMKYLLGRGDWTIKIKLQFGQPFVCISTLKSVSVWMQILMPSVLLQLVSETLHKWCLNLLYKS